MDLRSVQELALKQIADAFRDIQEANSPGGVPYRNTVKGVNLFMSDLTSEPYPRIDIGALPEVFTVEDNSTRKIWSVSIPIQAFGFIRPEGLPESETPYYDAGMSLKHDMIRVVLAMASPSMQSETNRWIVDLDVPIRAFAGIEYEKNKPSLGSAFISFGIRIIAKASTLMPETPNL